MVDDRNLFAAGSRFPARHGRSRTDYAEDPFSAGPCCEGFAVMENFGFLRDDRSVLQYRCSAFPCSETRPTSGAQRVKENKSVLS